MAKGKAAAAPKPKAAPKTTKTTKAKSGDTAPPDSAFKSIPVAFAEDLKTADAKSRDSGKTSKQIADENAEALATAMFEHTPQMAEDVEAEQEDLRGPIAEVVTEPDDSDDAADDTQDDVTDEVWEALARRGANIGLDAETMDGFKTADALENFLSVMEVRIAEKALEAGGKKKTFEEKVDEQAKERRREAAEEKKRETVDAEAGDRDEIVIRDDDFYDEETKQFAERLAKATNGATKQVRKLESRIADLEETIVGMREESAMSRFDQVLESELGPGWKDVLGEGPTMSLPRDSEQFENRHKLARLAVKLPSISDEGDKLTFGECVRRAAHGNWHEQARKLARGEAAEDAGKRRGVIKSRGRSVPKNIDSKDAVSAANEVVRNFMKRKGAGGPTATEQAKETLQSLGIGGA